MASGDRWTDDRLDDRFADIQRDLEALAKVNESLAGLSAETRHMATAINNLRDDLEKMAKAIKARDDVMVQERAANKRALWALTGTLGTALIAAVGTVLAAGVL